MRRYDVVPLEPGLRVTSSTGVPPLEPSIGARVDALWEAERRARPQLFDGPLFSIARVTPTAIEGSFVPYRRFLAQRRDPSLAPMLDVTPLGVSGIVLAGTAVGFGVRSDSVTQYPGHFELVPSGGIDDACLRVDGTIDWTAQLLRELAEETGIDAEAVRRVEPLALVRDELERTVDICALIAIDERAREASRSTGEYRALTWVPVDELAAFVARVGDRLVPTSAAIASAFLARSAQPAK